MRRRDFLQVAALGAGAMMMPGTMLGNPVPLDAPYSTLDARMNKELADAALNAARSKGASYADVRIGRYLNQYVFTREDKVQNIVNTESFGVGMRVIANGTWGFAATDNVSKEGIAKAAEQAVAIAKANARIQTDPVKLVPVPGYGEQSWKTPIEQNAFEVPVSEKVDLLLSANAAAMAEGANFVNNSLFMVNEQKYFASTEGSYLDQDIHRIWPTFTVTAIDSESGKFKTSGLLKCAYGHGL